MNLIKSDCVNVCAILSANPKKVLDNVINAVENIFWRVVQGESEINISIILALPAFFGETSQAGSAVGGNTQTGKAGRLALKALALGLPLGESVPHGAGRAKVAAGTLETVARAGRAERGAVDVKTVLAK